MGKQIVDITDYLKQQPIPDSQKSAAWQAFYGAKNWGDLKTKLDGTGLSPDLKYGLYSQWETVGEYYGLDTPVENTAAPQPPTPEPQTQATAPTESAAPDQPPAPPAFVGPRDQESYTGLESVGGQPPTPPMPQVQMEKSGIIPQNPVDQQLNRAANIARVGAKSAINTTKFLTDAAKLGIVPGGAIPAATVSESDQPQAKEAAESYNLPLVPLSEVVPSGYARGVARGIEGLSTPVTLSVQGALMGMGAAAPAAGQMGNAAYNALNNALGAYFTTHMAKGAASEVKDAYNAWKEGDYDKVAEHFGAATVDGLFAWLGTRHTIETIKGSKASFERGYKRGKARREALEKEWEQAAQQNKDKINQEWNQWEQEYYNRDPPKEKSLISDKDVEASQRSAVDAEASRRAEANALKSKSQSQPQELVLQPTEAPGSGASQQPLPSSPAEPPQQIPANIPQTPQQNPPIAAAGAQSVVQNQEPVQSQEVPPPTPATDSEARTIPPFYEPTQPPPPEGVVVRMRPTDMEVDPSTFQFKTHGIGQKGVGEELKGVTKWDSKKGGIIAVWRDPASGKIYVVNGHHRYELATSDRVSNRPDALNVMFIDADSAQEARGHGALLNIADGKGEPVDAAKVIRDLGITKEQLMDEGISIKGELAKKAAGLANLPSDIFDRVWSGELDQSKAAIVGEMLPERFPDQRAFFKLLDKLEKSGKRPTSQEIRRMIQMEVGEDAPRVEVNGDQGVLFGDGDGVVEERVPLYEKAQVAEYIRKQLRNDKKLFKMVGHEARAKQLEKAGNVIDVEASAGVSKEAGDILHVFDKLVSSAGAVSEALNSAAIEVAKGGNLEDAKSKAYTEVRATVEAEAERLFGGGRSKGAKSGDPVSPSGSNRDGQSKRIDRVPGEAKADSVAVSAEPPKPPTSKRPRTPLQKMESPKPPAKKAAQPPTPPPPVANAKVEQAGKISQPSPSGKNGVYRKSDVVVGGKYRKKVGHGVVDIEITAEREGGGWDGKNLGTGRSIRIKSAAGLRQPAAPFSLPPTPPKRQWKRGEYQEFSPPRKPVRFSGKKLTVDDLKAASKRKDLPEAYRSQLARAVQSVERKNTDPNRAVALYGSEGLARELGGTFSTKPDSDQMALFQKTGNPDKTVFSGKTLSEKDLKIDTKGLTPMERDRLSKIQQRVKEGLAPNKAVSMYATPSLARKLGGKLEWEQGKKQGELFEQPPAPVSFRTVSSKRQASTGAAMQLEPEPGPTWYSQLQRTVEDKVSGAVPADQLLALVKKPQSGVKPDELKWTGFDEWLQSKGSSKVTKQDALEYLKANDVKIEEVHKGDKRDISKEQKRLNELASLGGRRTQEQDREYVALTKQLHGNRPINTTKYSSYKIPGGTDYRELLLTIPNKGQAGTTEGYRSSHWEEPNVLAHMRFDDRTDANGDKVMFVNEIQSDWHQEGRKKGYRDEKSTKEWESIEKDGASYLNSIELNPSPYDFAWVLGEVPIQDKPTSDSRLRRLRALSDKFGEDWVKRARELSGNSEWVSSSIPAAPFAKTWHELAFRRALRYAAENGYDKLAWATGEQNANLYDLRKHIDRIEYEEYEDDAAGTQFDGKSGKLYELSVFDKDGKEILLEEDIEADRLEEFVGKDVAKRIINGDGSKKKDSPYRDWKVLDGLDLKTGGEGMIGFYDDIIPKYANKLGKKFGVKVGTTKIEKGNPNRYQITEPEKGYEYREFEVFDTSRTPSALLGQFETRKQAEEFVKEKQIANNEDLGSAEVHSIDITPEMRRSVMAGQPKFQKKRDDRTMGMFDQPPTPPKAWTKIVQDEYNDNKWTAIAKDGGRVVGELKITDHGDTWTLDHIHVNAKDRHRGHGKNMVQTAVAEGRKQGKVALFSSYSVTPDGERLMRSAGFKKATDKSGRTRWEYRLQAGKQDSLISDKEAAESKAASEKTAAQRDKALMEQAFSQKMGDAKAGVGGELFQQSLFDTPNSKKFMKAMEPDFEPDFTNADDYGKAIKHRRYGGTKSLPPVMYMNKHTASIIAGAFNALSGEKDNSFDGMFLGASDLVEVADKIKTLRPAGIQHSKMSRAAFRQLADELKKLAEDAGIEGAALVDAEDRTFGQVVGSFRHELTHRATSPLRFYLENEFKSSGLSSEAQELYANAEHSLRRSYKDHEIPEEILAFYSQGPEKVDGELMFPDLRLTEGEGHRLAKAIVDKLLDTHKEEEVLNAIRHIKTKDKVLDSRAPRLRGTDAKTTGVAEAVSGKKKSATTPSESGGRSDSRAFQQPPTPPRLKAATAQ